MLSRMLTNYLVLLFLPISLCVAPLLYMGMQIAESVTINVKTRRSALNFEIV